MLEDAHHECLETFVVRLSNAIGATLADAEATGDILNSGPLPGAWLGRFGRTAWEHALEAVDERLRSGRASRMRAAIAGRSIAKVRSEARTGEAEWDAAAWTDGGNGEPAVRALRGSECYRGVSSR